MKYNKNQQLAVDTIDKNVGLIAGAGTGKTAVLTGRYINIVEQSNQPLTEIVPSILAITFTEKATMEMSNRISEDLYKIDIDDQVGGDIKLIDPYLQIFTINGFCNKVLKENGYLINLKKSYEVIESHVGDIYLMDIIMDQLEELSNTPEFENFLIENEYITLDKLAADIKNIYRTIKSKGLDISSVFKYKSEAFDRADLLKVLGEIESTIERLLEDKVINGRLGLVKDYRAGFLEDLKNAKTSDIKDSLSLLIDRMSVLALADVEDIKNLIDPVYNSMMRLEDSSWEYGIFEELLIKVDSEFKATKLSKGYIEYDDQLEYTAYIFKNFPNVLETYKDKYRHIMIDEFQDTNYTQRDIFYMLATDETLLDRDNLFVVGDPKQSIYGFRGSELSIFEETLADIEHSDGLVINLETNYRSTPELIDIYNTIFSDLMGDDYQKIKGNKESIQINPTVVKFNDIEEPGAVVSLIQSLINDGTVESYSDIGILYPSRTNLKDLETELKKHEIPYNNQKSQEFFNQREIKDLILLLKFLNYTLDDLSLYGLLKSPYFMLSDSEINSIYIDRDISLYKNLVDCPSSNTKILETRNILQKTVADINSDSIYYTISRFLDRIKYREYLSLVEDDQSKISNIEQFLELTLEYEDAEKGRLNQYVNYLTEMEEVDYPEAESEDDRDKIDLLTIHSSKGLQYDHVILYDGARNPILNNSSMLLDKDYGIGIKLAGKDSYYQSVKKIVNAEEIEEYIRLLYVGLTRARENIYIMDREDARVGNRSFLKLLENFESYFDQIEIIDDTVSSIEEPKYIPEIVSGKPDREEISLTRPTSSISAYLVYKDCPRLYYYRYVIDMDSYIAEYDHSDQSEETLGYPGDKYGSFIHYTIENYNEDESIEQQLKANSTLYDLKWDLVKDRGISNINNYLKNKMPGRDIHEYKYRYRLENGDIIGSIDEINIGDTRSYVIDYKTNRYSDLDTLPNIYKDQLTMYKIVVESMLSREVEACINFLETGDMVYLDIDDIYTEDFLKRINDFLDHINNHNDIDDYIKTDKCNKYCKYKQLCREER